MRAPDGRAYSAPTQGNLNRSVQKNLEEIDRRMSRLPKTPKPPVGGGIVDMASVYTTDPVGIQWPSGATDLSFGSAVYAAPGYKVAGASWLSVTSGNIAVTEDGYYQAWCWFDLRWPSQAAAPGQSLSLYIGGDPSSAAPDGIYHPTQKAGLLWGVVSFITNGPELMTAGQYWRLEADGDTASSAAISRARASWRITKYA